MWTRITNGRCTEFVDYDPTGRSHPSILWARVPASLLSFANSDYLFVDGRVVPPSLDYLRKQVKASVTARRWVEQNRGALVGDHRFQTDAASRASLSDYLTVGQKVEHANPGTFEVKWKAITGFVTLSLDDIDAVLIAATMRVLDCFKRENELFTAIDAASDLNELFEISDTGIHYGWPV